MKPHETPALKGIMHWLAYSAMIAIMVFVGWLFFLPWPRARTLRIVPRNSSISRCPWCGYPEPQNEYEFWHMRDESLKLKDAMDDQKQHAIEYAAEDDESRKQLRSAMQDGMLSIYEAQEISNGYWDRKRAAENKKLDSELMKAAGLQTAKREATRIFAYELSAKDFAVLKRPGEENKR